MADTKKYGNKYVTMLDNTEKSPTFSVDVAVKPRIGASGN